MAHTQTTITILRARNAMLEAENRRLKGIIALADVRLTTPQPSEPDYSLGGHEFVDPTNGTDTWHS
jgi:hypothetical protein